VLQCLRESPLLKPLLVLWHEERLRARMLTLAAIAIFTPEEEML
jgi:hypothetical protein